MHNTKEKILLAALDLFAQDGYQAVSVSQIAGKLGITKGALYRHYQNKRDIFDHILSRIAARGNGQPDAGRLPAIQFKPIGGFQLRAAAVLDPG